ncbi:exported hypothetical protein [Frankia sp. Hr75.2]|nr:exported hypothetical protein [Frankia sp. Hr75.2]
MAPASAVSAVSASAAVALAAVALAAVALAAAGLAGSATGVGDPAVVRLVEFVRGGTSLLVTACCSGGPLGTSVPPG